jgi:hypothetical protein
VLKVLLALKVLLVLKDLLELKAFKVPLVLKVFKALPD